MPHIRIENGGYTAGNTLQTSFAISPTATALTPDPVQTTGKSVQLSGTPVAGDIWSVTVGFNDGGGLVTSTQDYVVRATVALAEVAAGLAAKISASGTGFTAYVSGNTLVVENPNEPGFVATARVAPAPIAAETVLRSVASPTVTRLTLRGTADIGETWIVTIGSATYAYTVESLEVIAAKLAAAIEANADATVIATSEGATLLLAHRDPSLAVTTRFTAATLSTGAAIAAAAVPASIVKLAGQPVAGERWTIGVNGTDDFYDVPAGNTVSEPRYAPHCAPAGRSDQRRGAGRPGRGGRRQRRARCADERPGDHGDRRRHAGRGQRTGAGHGCHDGAGGADPGPHADRRAGRRRNLEGDADGGRLAQLERGIRGQAEGVANAR
jgi:hypothetical protein